MSRYRCVGELADELGLSGKPVASGDVSVKNIGLEAISAIQVGLNIQVRTIKNREPKLYVTDLRKSRDSIYLATVSKRGEGRTYVTVGTFEVHFIP